MKDNSTTVEIYVPVVLLYELKIGIKGERESMRHGVSHIVKPRVEQRATLPCKAKRQYLLTL